MISREGVKNYEQLTGKEQEQSLSYESLLRKEEIVNMHSVVIDILSDEKLLELEDAGLETYSALKIQRDALEGELDSYSTINHTNTYTNSKCDSKNIKTKYSIAKVTNPHSIEFVTYLKALIENLLKKLPSDQGSQEFKSLGSLKLCYRKSNGKYVLSPTNYSTIRNSNSLKENLCMCKNHLESIITGYATMNKLPQVDLRKVMSENCLKPKPF